jgi:hypothetical protein
VIGNNIDAIVGTPAPIRPRPPLDIRTQWYFQHRALFDRAMRGPAAAYFKTRFDYQSNKTFCGVASAMNVLRSLGFDNPEQESFLSVASCPVPEASVRKQGVTLKECAELIRWHSRDQLAVETVQGGSFEDFRNALQAVNVERATTSTRVLVNFDRKLLFGGLGGGHICPVGAYFRNDDPEKDLVLLLDVNNLPAYRFYFNGKKEKRYCFVRAHDLYDASVRTTDGSSKEPRGLIVAEPIARVREDDLFEQVA